MNIVWFIPFLRDQTLTLDKVFTSSGCPKTVRVRVRVPHWNSIKSFVAYLVDFHRPNRCLKATQVIHHRLEQDFVEFARCRPYHKMYNKMLMIFEGLHEVFHESNSKLHDQVSINAVKYDQIQEKQAGVEDEPICSIKPRIETSVHNSLPKN